MRNTLKSRNPAGAGFLQLRIVLATDRTDRQLHVDIRERYVQDGTANCVVTTGRSSVQRIGPCPLPVFRYQSMPFRVRERKHTPGSSAPATGVRQLVRAAILRDCKPLVEIVAGSLHRNSKQRVRPGLGSGRQRGFHSRALARALDIPVLPNLPPTDNQNVTAAAKALALKPEGFSGGVRCWEQKQTSTRANSPARLWSSVGGRGRG